MSNFFQDQRMKFAAAHAAVPAVHPPVQPEHLPAAPAAAPPAPISALHSASMAAPAAIPSNPAGQDHEDAAHPFQWPAGGKWYSKEQASALADAANAANTAQKLADAKKAASTPIPVQRVVEPVVIDPSPVSALSVEPLSEKPIAYTTESNVAKAAPVIQPAPAAAQPAVPEHIAMSTNVFESFLKNIGKVLAKIIGVAGAIEASPAVQAAEAVAFGPAITALIEKWTNTAVTVETTAATAVGTAASTPGLTGAQKAAIVIAALNGDAQAVAQQLGASSLTQTDLGVINTAVVAILNVFKVPAA
jgi:hypothetical protein